MRTATKIRLYPTTEQQEKLAVQFGHTRFVWNKALSLKQETWQERGESLSYYTLVTSLPAWKEKFPWLKEGDSQVLQQSIRNLDRAYQNFFVKRARFPRFKSRHSRQAIQYPQRVKLEAARAYFPKVGWVKAVVHREIVGTIKTVTVSRATTGKYFASILVEDGAEQAAPTEHIDSVVGIDLGITDVVVTSNGVKSGNPRHLQQAEQNLKRKQQMLSRKEKGSRKRARARLLVAKAHERVANARHDFQHKITRQLARKNQAVVVENLAVKNMLKNHHLAKAISSAGWSNLTSKLKYKLERTGGHLVIIDRWYPSSKTCSVCQATLEVLPLSTRYWQCTTCETLHDRDVNAAQNIRHQGILKLKAEGLSVSAHEGCVSPS